jgi:hypothetical protein
LSSPGVGCYSHAVPTFAVYFTEYVSVQAKEHAVSEVVRKKVRALLTDLARLSEKVVNPNWLAEFEPENVSGY